MIVKTTMDGPITTEVNPSHPVVAVVQDTDIVVLLRYYHRDLIISSYNPTLMDYMTLGAYTLGIVTSSAST